MNETESLVLRARKYLNSAELLLNAGDYESSVSRSYYAMYFMVQSVLLHEGISASTHKGALSRFGDRFVKTGIFPKSAARSLSVAFEKRQLGDYESALVIEHDEADTVLASARETVALIANWLGQQGVTTDL